MKNTVRLWVVMFLVLSTGCAISTNKMQPGFVGGGDDYDITSRLYGRLINREDANFSMLNLFFTQMPKGGDLHHHYSGSIYAETYLDWVMQKGWFIDKCTLKIVKTSQSGNCELLTVQEVLMDNTLYRQLLMLWSDKDYDNHSHQQPPPDSNFFNTFGYFDVVSDEYMDVGLNIIKQRALKENVSYVESMLTRTGAQISDYYSSDELAMFNKKLRDAQTQKDLDRIFEKITATLLGNTNFTRLIDDFVVMVNEVHKDIDDENFMMRYQTYSVRVLQPMQVFIDLLSGHLAASHSPLVVGVNIVAPENNHIALDDYTLHMRMFNYLKGKYPNIHRALHAGELTMGMVRPKDLVFHIKEARDIAKAERVGHGIDLPYEMQSLELLKDLKDNAVIEINLTSNQFILGVEKNEHPYLIYSAYGVPMVISTDDSGVSRNNLTSEYVLLATRYKPGYEKIKEYVYNSIQYSFLTDSDKSAGKKLLNQKFKKFEREMAMLYRELGF